MDLKKKMEEAADNAESSLVAAYSILTKYSNKSGIDTLQVRQFKQSLDTQANTYIIDLLKEEEWLLDAVGLGTLRNNNLLPTETTSIKVKDVYEAFLRFDDKPMISGPEAISKSLQKYCTNGEYCIATGNDEGSFSRFFFKESVPFFDINDVTYWLVDKSLMPQSTEETKEIPATVTGTTSEPTPSVVVDPTQDSEETDVRTFQSISVSGNVPLERYTELFNYFITPFAMNGNKIEIEVSFKIKSSNGSPIDESKQQYKSAKEAANQLGLRFEEE